MKKILIISQYFYPNNFRINDLISKLSDKKYKIEIISSNVNYVSKKKDSAKKYERLKFPRKNFIIHRLSVISRNGSSFIGIALEYLTFIITGIYFVRKNIINKKKFDKVFVYGTSPIIQALIAIYVKKKLNIPIVLWVQDLWPQSVTYTGYIKNEFLIQILRNVTGYIYKNSDVILIQSPDFKKKIKDIYNHKNIHYLPNPPEEINIKKRNFFINKNNFNIFYAGNFGKAQNLEILLKAANLLKNKTKIKFYFFGDKKTAKDLLKLKKKYKLENCYFPGYVEKKYFTFLLKNASALTLGLKKNEIWYVTIPSKLQSYLNSGRPIIGFLSGTAAQIIKESKVGYVVGPDDFKGLAKTIEKLSKKTKKSLNIMGMNGKKYCKKYFNINNITNKLEIFLNEA